MLPVGRRGGDDNPPGGHLLPGQLEGQGAGGGGGLCRSVSVGRGQGRR